MDLSSGVFFSVATVVAGLGLAKWRHAALRSSASRTGKDPVTGVDRDHLRTLDTYAATLGLSVRDAFALDWSVIHLNHGSYGTAPRPVLKAAAAELLAIERFPDDYFRRRALKQFTNVCDDVARFVGAEPGSVALVRGINCMALASPWKSHSKPNDAANQRPPSLLTLSCGPCAPSWLGALDKRQHLSRVPECRP